MLRFQGTTITVGTSGTNVAHGLTNPVGAATAAAPTEWSINQSAGNAGFSVYRNGAPTTTLFGLASSGGNVVVDLMCSIPHSRIQ
jgi:hypothetical protein